MGAMPLTLVLGPANSAKAGEVLGAYGPPPAAGRCWSCPTAARRRALLARAGRRGRGPRARCSPSPGLARRDRAPGAVPRPRGCRRSSASGCCGACSAACALEVAGRSAAGRVRGGGRRADRRARALAHHAAAVRRGAAAWAARTDAAAATPARSASLYRAYARELERLGRVDRELFAWRALDALRAEPRRWGRTPVFFYGFDDLTGARARRGRDAVAGRRRRGHGVAHLRARPRGARRARRGGAGAAGDRRRGAASCRRSTSTTRPRPATALHHLERWLFEPAPSAIDPGDAVRLLEAGGERAEAELVAAEVLELLRAGVPAEEIAVVYRSLTRVGAAVERVFARYGIPLAGERACRSRTRRSGGQCWRSRAARCSARPARAPRTCWPTCARPGCSTAIEIVDGLEAEVRRDGLGPRPRRASAWAGSSPRSTRCGGAATRRRAGAPGAAAARAPHRAAAPRLDPDARSSTPARCARCCARSAELAELRRGAAGQPSCSSCSRARGSERGRRWRRAPCCSPSRWRSGPAASARCSSAGCTRASSRSRARASPFLSDERRRELPQASGLRLRAARGRAGARALPVLRLRRRAPPSADRSATAAPTRRATWRCPRRSSPTSRSCSSRVARARRRRLLADVVWPAGAGADRSASSTRALAAADARPPRRARPAPARSLERGGARARAPHRGRLGRRARELRRLPGAVAGRERARAGAVRARARAAGARQLHARRAGASVRPARGAGDAGVAAAARSGSSTRCSPSCPPGSPPAALKPCAGRAAGIEADLRRYLEHEAA